MTIAFKDITPETQPFIDTIFAGEVAQYWLYYNAYWWDHVQKIEDIQAKFIFAESEPDPVGFIVYGQHYEDADLTQKKAGWYEVIHLVIDEKYQRKGYGRLAMHQAIAILKAIPDCEAVVITHNPENLVARQLYLNLGFVDIGEDFEGDRLLQLSIGV